MFKSTLRAGLPLALFAALTFSTTAFAENPMVGGAAMYEKMNIVENAMNSKVHTTLVAAVKAAGLVDTLMSDGPFTVFAPTNDAFDALPMGTVEKLLKPENKDMLAKILTAHVVAGNVTAKDLWQWAEKNGGKYEFETVSGDMLTASIKDGKLWLWDENGNAAEITIADVMQSNGIIHVVDKVLLPK